MIHVGWVFAAMAATFAVAMLRPALAVADQLSFSRPWSGRCWRGFGVPFRHLVEGGFGYLNLILALFAGAFFGQVMRHSGAADALADVDRRRGSAASCRCWSRVSCCS